ncbi:MAG: hypothetical protein ACP5OC_01980 [Thermoplasmata archaeon]
MEGEIVFRTEVTVPPLCRTLLIVYRAERRYVRFASGSFRLFPSKYGVYNRTNGSGLFDLKKFQ